MLRTTIYAARMCYFLRKRLSQLTLQFHLLFAMVLYRFASAADECGVALPMLFGQARALLKHIVKFKLGSLVALLRTPRKIFGSAGDFPTSFDDAFIYSNL
jgi:hypothetical protein